MDKKILRRAEEWTREPFDEQTQREIAALIKEGDEKELVLSANITSIEIEPLDIVNWNEFTEISSRGDIIFDIFGRNRV